MSELKLYRARRKRVKAVSEVRSLECIDCNLCVDSCPVPNTLTLNGPRGKTRASAAAALWITVAIFAVVIGVTSVTGDFQWALKPLEETVELAQGFDPALIKGSDTFLAVSELTGIAKEEFLQRFPISEEDFTKPIRDVAHRPTGGFEVEELREFVRERLAR